MPSPAIIRKRGRLRGGQEQMKVPGEMGVSVLCTALFQT
jgi:hypothetical protein